MSPMPGKVIALLAPPGKPVVKGAPLLILEAMKMEHTIAAPSAGVVLDFHFAAGDTVAEGVVLLAFEARDTEDAPGGDSSDALVS
jgi:3-methylcrotonyl-CoA carboxylase alpha subunit